MVDKHGVSGARKPTRKQGLFLCNKYNAVFEGFYGGAAGGAKSDAMLMAALQFVNIPNYRALIIRRTFKQLAMSGALMERANTWLSQTDATWHDYTKTWTFPSGAKLTFGHVEHEKNKEDYQSASFHFIGIDEVTDLAEQTYTFLISRCRRTTGDEYIPLRFRSASNPIGPGLGWVKRRFVVPVKDRKKASIFRINNDDGGTDDRFFIPANLRDNPYLDIHEYTKALNKLDDVTKKRLLNGDWDAQQTGAVFDTTYLELISRSEVPARLQKYRYWDLAGTDKEDNPNSSNTVGLLYGVDSVTGYDYVLDVVKFQRNPTDVEQTLERVAMHDGRNVEVHIEQEPGQSGKAQIHAFQNRLDNYTVRGDLPGKRGNKETRAKPIANKIGRRRVRVVEADWNEDFFSDLSGFPGSGADTVDALSGAHAVSRNAPMVQSTNRMHNRRSVGSPKILFRGEKMN